MGRGKTEAENERRAEECRTDGFCLEPLMGESQNTAYLPKFLESPFKLEGPKVSSLGKDDDLGKDKALDPSATWGLVGGGGPW